MRRWLRRAAVVLAAMLMAPLAASAVANGSAAQPWWAARTDSTGQAPDPAVTDEAVVQVYVARAFGWRGVFGVHSWFAVKPRGAASYRRLEVMGWAVRHGGRSVRISQGVPDGYWFGAYPTLIKELRGAAAQALIPRILAAAESYPYDARYSVWPGPNSNSFTAHIARAVPELRLKLPATAVGRDYLTNGGIIAAAPSGTGYQLSLFGLFGVLAARAEGIEINILGLVFGIDFENPAIKLPGIGRIGTGTQP
jgi:Protein of unknown function (DUF3750)